MSPREIRTRITPVILVILVSLISGCELGTVRSDVHNKLPSFRSQVEPGVTTRSETNKRLGKPVLKSDQWSVEVYRVAKGDDVAWGLAGVIPLPMPDESRDVFIYAMVLYDMEGIVKEVDWDLFTDKEGGRVRAGDVIFLITPARPFAVGSIAEYLFLGEDASRKALHLPAPKDGCRITIQRQTTEEVWIDGQLVIEDRGDGGSGFIQLDLKPGKHILVMKTPFLGFRPREFTAGFTCTPGSLSYAYLDIELVPSGKTGVFSDRFRNKGSVIVEDDLPQHFLNKQKLLYHSGKWLDDF